MPPCVVYTMGKFERAEGAPVFAACCSWRVGLIANLLLAIGVSHALCIVRTVRYSAVGVEFFGAKSFQPVDASILVLLIGLAPKKVCLVAQTKASSKPSFGGDVEHPT